MQRARARTSGEMSFFASLESCPACGKRVEPDDLTIYGDGDAWSLTGPCRYCKGPLAFKFQTNGNPIEGARAFGELGTGHSAIISPRKFIDEIERLSPTVDTQPTQLAVGPWKANRDVNKRVRVCLAELAKFIPAGADAIPSELVPPEDLADRAARPDRYQRAWIEALSARHKQVSDANVADLPRIEAADTELDRKRPKGVDYVEREHLVAHEKWVQRGKTGKGRLVLVDALHEGMKLGRGVELAGARFDNVNFTEAYLEDANLVDAEIENVRFDRAHLYGSLLHGARVNAGSFEGADLKQVEFTNARIEGTRFDGANLDHSVWSGAQVTFATFAKATFGNASLDGGVFTRCDLRNADLSGPDPKRPPTTRARFDGCDLRDANWEGRDLAGATFVGCKLAGAKGRPSSVAGIVIENPDAPEVLAGWGIPS